ncbi:MFS transporter [Gordonia alkaliphila]|uniref:MFS transporter n=1 Tax=Gordonia alkaliphila TaxID=1053547 RepID=A0ABP8Z7V1_9ACTN|nr:MFS transporter [Gordonia alkaliphila]MCK0439994.1 MFS transporter [Gordonia alkaliphila]
MHNLSTLEAAWKHRSRRSVGAVITVAGAYLLIMAGTTLPTPLYPIYREEFGFSVFIVTVIFATYVLGVLVALFGVGRWSDVFGRKPMLVAALGSALISTVLFLVADDLAVLLIARFFAGLSSGIFVGTATVHMVELAPEKWKPSSASFLATAVNVFGLGVGPLFGGLVVQFIDFEPLRTVFWILLGLQVLAVLAILTVPETVTREKPLRIPKFHRLTVPVAARPAFRRAVLPGVVGFAMLGLYGAVAPSLLSDPMGIDSVAIQGAAVFAVFAGSAVMQLATGAVPERTLILIGCLLLLIGCASISAAILGNSAAGFIIAGVVGGAGQGATMSKGVAQVATAAPADERAATTSTLFFCFYLGLAFPAIGIGAAALEWGLPHTTEVFGLLCAAGAAAALAVNYFGTREPRHPMASVEQ